MRKVPFVNDKYYHVYNRGVDKRQIFQDENDYFRFLAGLVIFNDTQNRTNLTKTLKEALDEADKRKKIVDIIAYCLMPNHFHLLVKQSVEGGLSLFLKKLGIGYTHYFNKKYERSGVLFQGKSKNSLVDNDVHLLHLSRYIHLNPAELSFCPEDKFDFVENYPWSSCRFYTQNKSTKILSGQQIILDQFKGKEEYLSFLKDYQEELDLSYIKDYLFD